MRGKNTGAWAALFFVSIAMIAYSHSDKKPTPAASPLVNPSTAVKTDQIIKQIDTDVSRQLAKDEAKLKAIRQKTIRKQSEESAAEKKRQADMLADQNPDHYKDSMPDTTPTEEEIKAAGIVGETTADREFREAREASYQPPAPRSRPGYFIDSDGRCRDRLGRFARKEYCGY